jgi:putative flippase GtrA
MGGEKPSEMPQRYMPAHIYGLLGRIPRAGQWLQRRYLELWNPANYAIVGGIGVIINYAVWALLLHFLPWLPWFLNNALAILTAWSWNWANSVGPWGWIWGFKKRGRRPE